MVAHLTEDLREDLLARWSESHRRAPYRRTICTRCSTPSACSPATGIELDREAVELAAWFHDVIYEVGRDDNEERSADLARQLLASSPVREEVARLVLVTKTHKPAADDIDGAVLSDADLSMLGSAARCYRELRRAPFARSTPTSRTRYSNRLGHRCLRLFWTGPIFHTGPGRERWEDQARRNVADEIGAERIGPVPRDGLCPASPCRNGVWGSAAVASDTAEPPCAPVTRGMLAGSREDGSAP